jgi:steroid 5-alpha reductase family enzyme/predicted DCC family thiol-disulfide oxidoreductase YuxK
VDRILLEKFVTTLFFTFGALSLFVFISFFLFLIKKRKDIADTLWGIGFLIVTWTSFLLNGFSYNGLTVALLVTIWAIRLSVHIHKRNKNRKEDFRYANFKTTTQIFFQVFILQGLILYVVALPIIWIQTHPLNETPFIPILIWSVGFFIESISDYQLDQFKKNESNKNKLLATGLWGYVRHPNYLGEIIQWWAIWMISLYLPYGFLFIISPLLISLLIIFVSGVKPLEEKMKKHPDFKNYSEKTPSIIPISLINGLLYTITWYLIVSNGGKGLLATPLFVGLIFYLSQLILFSKYDQTSFLVCIPLSIFTLMLGFIQESFFIQTKTLLYPHETYFPPLWLLTLYPAFSLTLNSSLSFLNKNLYLSFFLGGLGACLSYLTGEKLHGAIVESIWSYPVIFLSWGLFLSFILRFNRKMIELKERFTNPEKLSQQITVFFDISCPLCAKEMNHLKKRKQTGAIHYATPQSDLELKKITTAFSYDESMQSIHGLTQDGKILKGINTLSEVYARTNLPLLAIFLQAPLFSWFFRFAYWIWTKIR